MIKIPYYLFKDKLDTTLGLKFDQDHATVLYALNKYFQFMSLNYDDYAFLELNANPHSQLHGISYNI